VRKAAPEPSAQAHKGKEAVVDQSFTEPQNLGANINEGTAFVAQTYTAGVDGRLWGINIDVRSKRGLNPDLGLERYLLHSPCVEWRIDIPAPFSAR
jgi:hypothetical protein